MTISADAVFVALEAFLVLALPEGVEIIRGQQNRVPEPRGTFVVMTPILRSRLGTNVVINADVAFSGTASGSVLTVNEVRFGEIVVGAQVYGPSIVDGTRITGQTGGAPGGVGTYGLSVAQPAGAAPLAAGRVTITEPARQDVQIDVHSADLAEASDLAARITTMFCSDPAIEAMDPIAPLYASDARQIPFSNAEAQTESRQVIDLSMQVGQPIDWPQAFADVVTISPYPVH